MKRNANAVWNGRLKDGHGLMSTESGVLQHTPYSFAARFESQAGTNPEELIAAAHAACFSMALANELEVSKLDATPIATKASVRMDLLDGKWTIQEVDLFLNASLQGAPSVPFLVAASRAKVNCPISRALATKVTLHTELKNQHPGSETEAEVVIYTSTFCQVCGQAKTLLESQGIHYREVDLDQEPSEVADELKRKTGRMSVPQIFVGDHFIGSYDDLIQLDADHGLQKLLQPNGASTPIGLTTKDNPPLCQERCRTRKVKNVGAKGHRRWDRISIQKSSKSQPSRNFSPGVPGQQA